MMRFKDFIWHKDGKSYGGQLRNTRRGRSCARPLSYTSSIHLVLRSTKAKGSRSFVRPHNDRSIRKIIEKFTKRFDVRVIRLANVGNHLHFEIQVGSRTSYKRFIRAVTSAIAFAIMKNPAPVQLEKVSQGKTRFWDLRPFTRIVSGFMALWRLRDYIHLNQLEGFGYSRAGTMKVMLRDSRQPTNTA